MHVYNLASITINITCSATDSPDRRRLKQQQSGHLSKTACLRRVFFKSFESCSKFK